MLRKAVESIQLLFLFNLIPESVGWRVLKCFISTLVQTTCQAALAIYDANNDLRQPAKGERERGVNNGAASKNGRALDYRVHQLQGRGKESSQAELQHFNSFLSRGRIEYSKFVEQHSLAKLRGMCRLTCHMSIRQASND